MLNIGLLRTEYETLERHRILQERRFREGAQILEAARQRYRHLNRNNIHEHDMHHRMNEDRRNREREFERQRLTERRRMQRDHQYQRDYE